VRRARKVGVEAAPDLGRDSGAELIRALRVRLLPSREDLAMACATEGRRGGEEMVAERGELVVERGEADRMGEVARLSMQTFGRRVGDVPGQVDPVAARLGRESRKVDRGKARRVRSVLLSDDA